MQLRLGTMLAIGIIPIALGILNGRFVHIEYSRFSVTNFIEGALVVLPLVMNLASIIHIRKPKKMWL